MDINKNEGGKVNTKGRLICLCEGAVMTALALALSYLKFKLFPTGGSVDLVMIPLIVFSLRRGPVWGIGAGLIFGTLKCFLSEGVGYGWQAILLDYSIAYSAVGLSGVFRNTPVVGTAVGSLGRYFVHVLSGVILWGMYMPEEFLGLAMKSVWIYSLLYNATYMLPNAVIASAAIILISRGTKLLEANKG